MQIYKLGSGIFYLWYLDPTGRRKKVSTRCRNRRDAERFAKSYQPVPVGLDVHSPAASIALSTFRKEHSEYSKSTHTPKTHLCYDLALRQLGDFLGDVPFGSVNIRQIEAFLSMQKEKASEWTARKNYAALASAFETGVRWSYIETNPFRKVKKPRGRELQPVFLTEGEFRTLIGKVDNADLNDLFICAVLSGLRSAEIRSLRWNDVDLGRRILTVQNSDVFTTKSKKNRMIPMNDTLTHILKERRKKATREYVFTLNGKPMREEYLAKTFKRYVLRAGLNPKFHFHSLRHAFATWLVRKGVPLYEVQKLMGHASIVTTQIYSHLEPGELHESVAKIVLDESYL